MDASTLSRSSTWLALRWCEVALPFQTSRTLMAEVQLLLQLDM